MSTETKKEIELEIAYVLFIDIVGYSKLVTSEQRRLLELLNQIVHETEHFRAAEAKGRLITVPTGDGMALVFYNKRLWRFLDLVAPSRKFSPQTPNMDLPFSVKPDKKLSVREVMALTRDKSRGGLFDPLKGIRGGPFLNPNYHRSARQISVPNVEYTTLTQCRGGFPPEIGGIVWIALGAQDTSCYVPFYAGVTEIPGSYSIGDHWVFNRDAARWAFDTVDYHAQVAYAPAIEVIKAAQEKWEGAAVAATADVDRTAAELFRKGRAGAVTYLTAYCLNNARSVIEAWWKLGDELLVRFNHFGDYDTVKRSRGRLSPADSSLWPKAVKAIDILENQQ